MFQPAPPRLFSVSSAIAILSFTPSSRGLLPSISARGSAPTRGTPGPKNSRNSPCCLLMLVSPRLPLHDAVTATLTKMTASESCVPCKVGAMKRSGAMKPDHLVAAATTKRHRSIIIPGLFESWLYKRGRIGIRDIQMIIIIDWTQLLRTLMRKSRGLLRH